MRLRALPTPPLRLPPPTLYLFKFYLSKLLAGILPLLPILFAKFVLYRFLVFTFLAVKFLVFRLLFTFFKFLVVKLLFLLVLTLLFKVPTLHVPRLTRQLANARLMPSILLLSSVDRLSVEGPAPSTPSHRLRVELRGAGLQEAAWTTHLMVNFTLAMPIHILLVIPAMLLPDLHEERGGCRFPVGKPNGIQSEGRHGDSKDTRRESPSTSCLLR